MNSLVVDTDIVNHLILSCYSTWHFALTLLEAKAFLTCSLNLVGESLTM